MKNEKEMKENPVAEMNQYKQKISEMVKSIENTWILKEIIRFIENIQK